MVMQNQKKKPHNISLWILVVGLWISLVIHQYRDSQVHQELYRNQQKNLHVFQKLEECLEAQLASEQEESSYLREILEHLQGE